MRQKIYGAIVWAIAVTILYVLVLILVRKM